MWSMLPGWKQALQAVPPLESLPLDFAMLIALWARSQAWLHTPHTILFNYLNMFAEHLSVCPDIIYLQNFCRLPKLKLCVHHTVTPQSSPFPVFGNHLSTFCLSEFDCSRFLIQVALVVKNPPTIAGDIRDSGSILESGRSPGGGHGNPLQYSCLENPMDRGAWRATVHGVTKGWTGLKPFIMHSIQVPHTSGTI